MAKTATKPNPEETVTYTAPLLAGDQRQDILVAVNGECVRIRRGESVLLKRAFAEVLDNAQQQALCAHRAMAAAQAQSGRALATL